MTRRRIYSILATLFLFGGLYFMNYKMVKKFAPKWRDSTGSATTYLRADSSPTFTGAVTFPADTNQMPLDSTSWISEHSKIEP